MNLGVSVDWDFFFPNINQWDYGHKENPFFINQIWQLRASSPSNPIEKIVPRESYRRFWNRLEKLGLKPPICFVTESHTFNFDLVMLEEGLDVLLVFDQHVDAYDKHPEHVTCENWLLQSLRRAPQLRAYVVLPTHQWDDDKANGPEIPEDVSDRLTLVKDPHFEGLAQEFRGANVLASYICRSGAWTPPWSDDQFMDFLSGVEWMEFPEHGLFERTFDLGTALQVGRFLSNQQKTPFFLKSGLKSGFPELRHSQLLLEVPYNLSQICALLPKV